MVYFVKLKALFYGFQILKKLNSGGAVLRFHHEIYFSESMSFPDIKKSILAYKILFHKTLEINTNPNILISGLDMLNALKCLPLKNTSTKQIEVIDADLMDLKSLNKHDNKFQYNLYSSDKTKHQFNLILAHGSAIPDFEKVENLCNALGKGQLYIKIETGNIAGLNQFEKLRLFFKNKTDVLVSTYPFNEESDIILIEKKWV